MVSEVDLIKPRLRFGPRPSAPGTSARIVRLTIRLTLVLALMVLFAGTAFDSFGTFRKGPNESGIPGTAMIEPEGSPPNLPAGMVKAVSDQLSVNENDDGKSQENKGPRTPSPERTRGEDLPFLMESITDLDRDLPPALYYHFLDKARQAPTERLIADARRDITFSHLYKDPRNEPRKYRGQLVGLRGTVRRALAFDVEPNAYGLSRRYEIWVFTEDSGKFPWVVELTNLPESFPLGTDIQEKVETAGFFLKLWAYRAQDGFRSAPLLLGHGLTWNRTDLLRSRFDRQFGAFALSFLGIFAAIIASMIWRWNREPRPKTGASATRVYDRLDDIPVDGVQGDGALSDQTF